MNTNGTIMAGAHPVTCMTLVKEKLPGTQEHKAKKAAENMTDTHGMQDRTFGTALKDKMTVDKHGRTDRQAFAETGGYGTGVHDSATGAYGGSAIQKIKAALPGTQEHKIKKDAQGTGTFTDRHVGTTPMRTTPMGAMGATPMGATPMGATPMGATGTTTGSNWEKVPGTQEHRMKKNMENMTDTHGEINRTPGTALHDKMTLDSYGRTDGQAQRGDPTMVRPQV